MSNEDIELDDSSTIPSEEDVNTEDVEETSAEEQTEDTPEYTEHERKLFARAKKAEAELRALKAKQATPETKPQNLNNTTSPSSYSNIREFKAIVDLNDEDADYVVTYAEKFGMSLSEARKNKDVQAILNVRAEERKSASVANTGPTRRGSAQVSGEKLLERANSGQLPDDEDALRDLVKARIDSRRSK